MLALKTKLLPYQIAYTHIAKRQQNSPYKINGLVFLQ